MSPRFSERVGAVKVEIQMGEMNDALKNSIWNVVDSLIVHGREEMERWVIRLIATNVLRVPVQHVAYSSPRHWLLQCYESLKWGERYDLLEYVVENASHFGSVQGADRFANQILEREHSGYRFVAGRLAPITTQTEIAEIEQAAESAAKAGLDGVRAHVSQAVALFGKRPDPDYRNAIKEAISAVEGVVKLVTNTRGGGLTDALDILAPKVNLHPALKAGLEKLYGYTSDAGGIRHPILDEQNVREEDARFMVVTCSAVVTFLIVKAEVAGLLK